MTWTKFDIIDDIGEAIRKVSAENQIELDRLAASNARLDKILDRLKLREEMEKKAAESQDKVTEKSTQIQDALDRKPNRQD